MKMLRLIDCNGSRLICRISIAFLKEHVTMKHAVLILAHKNYPLLCRLIRYFAKDCEVFVHVDKKSKFTKDEIGQLYEYD